MLLYVCEHCHTWQDQSIAKALNNVLAAFCKGFDLKTDENAVGTSSLFQCPNGCGAMTFVQTTDKIMVVPTVEAMKESTS